MERQEIITLLQKHFAAAADEKETAALMQWLAQVNAAEFDEIIESFPNPYRDLKQVNPAFAARLEARLDAIDNAE
jgi:hypothetical protein